MKIIDAKWELRNLGVTTKEILVEKGDTTERIRQEIQNHTAEYTVIKCPTGMPFVYDFLSKNGFSFVETMLHLYKCCGEKVETEFEYLTRKDGVEFIKMTEDDFEELLEKIDEGLFCTDRISMDSAFGIKKAANRYKGWLKDNRDKGDRFRIVKICGKNAGFINYRETDKDTYHEVLYGLYPEFQGKGYSFVFSYYMMQQLRLENKKKLLIDISTNNTASVRARLKCGYLIDDFTNIFVSHRR